MASERLVYHACSGQNITVYFHAPAASALWHDAPAAASAPVSETVSAIVQDVLHVPVLHMCLQQWLCLHP